MLRATWWSIPVVPVLAVGYFAVLLVAVSLCGTLARLDEEDDEGEPVARLHVTDDYDLVAPAHEIDDPWRTIDNELAWRGAFDRGES